MADDLARLGIQVDSSGAVKATGDLDKLAASAGNAQAATDSLATSSKSATASLRDVGTASGATRKATDELRAAYASGAAVTSAQIQAAGGWAAAQKIMQESNAATVKSEQIKATTIIGAERAAATAAVESAAIQAAANDHVVGSSIKIRESLVLLREASVGNFTRMAGSASILLGAFGLMTAVIVPLVAAGAALGAVFALATNQINSGAKGTGDLAVGLGLTADQLDRVKDRYVTLGDTIKATFQVIWEGLVGPDFSTKVQSVWNAIADFIYESMVISTGAVQGGVNDMVEAWKAMPKVLGGEGTTAGIDFAKAFKKGMDDTRAQMDKFYGDIAARARKNARDRIREEGGKATGSGDRVDEVARATGQLKQLQDGTAAQRAYNDALQSGSMTMAEYARQESIDNGVKSLVVKYNADVAAGTTKSKEEAAKLLPIINALKVAYGEAYDQKMVLQQIAINDNLQKQNDLLALQVTWAGKAAEQRALELAHERALQQLLRDGVDPNSAAGSATLDRTDVGVRRQYDLQRSSLLNDNVDSGTALGTSSAKNVLADTNANPENLIKQQQAAFAEIDALRQQDVLSETQAALAKAQVNDDLMQRRLQGTSDFYGALSGLAGSSNKELAAIGKASALAQATISAYSAINKAWDSAPFPANLGAVAIVTAQTFANVAAIEGFQGGGYTGNGATNAIAGVVHGQEWVTNAQGTRGNVNTLAAMNAGAKFDGIGRPANNGGLKIVVNNNAPVTVSARQMSDDEILIAIDQGSTANVFKHGPAMIEGEMSNGNKKGAKAVKRLVGPKG